MAWHEAWGGRKFILAAAAILGAFLLGLLGKLTGEYATVSSISVGAFSLANMRTTAAALRYGANSGEPPA